jgi:hypothetical protein
MLVQAAGGDLPAVLFSGNKEFKIDADVMYVDETYVTMFLAANNNITIVFGPVSNSFAAKGILSAVGSFS